MFIEKNKTSNIADDNTLYHCVEDLSNILRKIKHDMKIIFKWFNINSLQTSPDKYQLMIVKTKTRISIKLKTNPSEIE